MAKLNGVKTLDMANGNITRIEYEGAEYTKVDGIEEAVEIQTGDIGLVGGKYGGRSILANSFYKMRTKTLVGDKWLGIVADENGNENGLHFTYFVVFRKASAAPQVGDFVIIIPTKHFTLFNYKVGDIAKVTGFRDDGYIYVQAEGKPKEHMHPSQLHRVSDEEIAPKPKTGDIVVITANTNSSRNKVGDIGKISGSVSSGARVDVPGRTGGNGNWTKESEMRLATPAEIAEYETTAEQEVKDAVFTKAGRKPNEYRKGDVVKILGKSHTGSRNKPGDIGVVTEIDRSGLRVDVPARDVPGANGNHHIVDNVEIVCFAENRADLAKGSR